MEKIKPALLILICILGVLTLSYVFMGNNSLKEVQKNIVLIQGDLKTLDKNLNASIDSLDSIIGGLKVTNGKLDSLSKERNDLVAYEQKRRGKAEQELSKLKAELKKSKDERKKLIEQAKSFEL